MGVGQLAGAGRLGRAPRTAASPVSLRHPFLTRTPGPHVRSQDKADLWANQFGPKQAGGAPVVPPAPLCQPPRGPLPREVSPARGPRCSSLVHSSAHSALEEHPELSEVRGQQEAVPTAEVGGGSTAGRAGPEGVTRGQRAWQGPGRRAPVGAGFQGQADFGDQAHCWVLERQDRRSPLMARGPHQACREPRVCVGMGGPGGGRAQVRPPSPGFSPASGLWGTPDSTPVWGPLPTLAISCAPGSPQGSEAGPHPTPWGAGLSPAPLAKDSFCVQPRTPRCPEDSGTPHLRAATGQGRSPWASFSAWSGK